MTPIKIWNECDAAQACKMQDRRRCEKLLMALVVMFGVQIFTCIYWIIQPPSPPTVSTRQVIVNREGVEQKIWRAGDTPYVQSEQTVTREGARTAAQYLFDEDRNIVVFRYEKRISPNNNKGKISRAFAVPIPPYTPPGNYSVRVTIGYWLNIFQPEATYELPPAPFRVVP